MHSKNDPELHRNHKEAYASLRKKSKELFKMYTDACDELVRKCQSYKTARANANLVSDRGICALDFEVFVAAECQMLDAKWDAVRQGEECQAIHEELTMNLTAIRELAELCAGERLPARAERASDGKPVRRMPWRPDREDTAKKKGRGRGPSASPVRK